MYNSSEETFSISSNYTLSYEETISNSGLNVGNIICGTDMKWLQSGRPTIVYSFNNPLYPD